ncbi:MAG: Uma2 family endonuclease [Roseiflexaceae bacterium]|nr:Uma2 family endonuclease [Roseiflexaceae bacterium]
MLRPDVITEVPLRNQLPPLLNGDRLTRREFERRYSQTPTHFKAELIEGRAYVVSPVRLDVHGEQHAYVMTWLGVYSTYTPGLRIGDNATVRLDADNEPQPDALLLLPNGSARIGPDGYVEGPPELVIEIAASSAAYDLYEKRDVYRRNRVREYAVWQIYEQKLDWWALQDEVYQPLPIEDGVIKSRVFPGLWLHAPALLRGEMPTVLATLQQGLADEEHAAFKTQLLR